jgi:LacI family transcriptional regulator
LRESWLFFPTSPKQQEFCSSPPPDLSSPGKLVSNVSIDYQRGISQAIDHVIELGHQRAAVTAGPEDNRTAVLIQRTLEVGLRERKLDPFSVTHCDWRVEAATSAAQTILSSANPPSVFFAEMISSPWAPCVRWRTRE